MEKKKLTVVGAGSIGRRHLRLLSERGDVALSVVEPSEQCYGLAVKDVGELPRYASLEDALAARPDAVAIATPHTMHADQTVAALNAGVHVFCEKPMSDTAEGCARMNEAAKRSGKVLSIGYMFHFDPFVREIKRVCDSGELGELLHYYSRFGGYIVLMNSLSRHQEHTPCSVMMDCIHDTDLLCWFFGRLPETVTATGIKSGDMEFSSNPNIVDVTYKFGDSRSLAHTHFNYVQFPQAHYLEITGDKGYIRGDFMDGSIVVGKLSGGTKEYTVQRDMNDVYRAEWDSFLKALSGGPVENPGETAAYATQLLQASARAFESGGVERIDARG